MKYLWIIFFSLVFTIANLSVIAQDVTSSESIKMQSEQKDVKKLLSESKSIGLATGYYTTVGLSYNQFFAPFSSFSVNLGYRIPGGWLGGGENTRIGAIFAYEYHYPLNSNSRRLVTAFGTTGFHIAQADYSDRGGLRDYGETFMTSGVTFGLGLSLRWNSFNISGAWRPAYDFLNYEYGGGKFYVWRCSQVAIRYIL